MTQTGGVRRLRWRFAWAVVAAIAGVVAVLVAVDGTSHRRGSAPATGAAASSAASPRHGSTTTSSRGPIRAPAPCALLADLAPTCGAWWGMALDTPDQELYQAVTAAEAATSRRLDIVHVYHRWADSFPTATEREVGAGDRLLFINWQPTSPSGRPISWAAIAKGSYDGVINAEAARLRSYGRPLLLSFSHEPDHNWGRYGTAAQFVAAYRYVHNLLQADGVTNVRWVWTVQGIANATWEARYRQLWPGAGYVDWVAWDPYNFGACMARPWRSFAATIGPFYQWLSSPPFSGLPLMLGEYGSVAGKGAAQSKAVWYQGESTVLGSFPRLKALVYFDYPSPPATCDWRPETSPGGQASFRKLAADAPFAATAGINP